MAEALPTFVARRKPDWTKLEGTLERLRAGEIDVVAGLRGVGHGGR